MGLVNYLNKESGDDDYSAEVIGLARDRSERIANWLAEEAFLLETPQENVTTDWLRNRCVVMIIEDLEQMGIHIGIPTDDICDQPQLVYAVLMLRAKFDEDNLLPLLKSHRNIREIWNEISVDTDCLVDFVSRCSDLLPLDEGWLMLLNTFDEYPGMFENDHVLTDSINELCGQCDASSPSIDEDVDPDCALKFIQLLGRRAAAICELSKKLLLPVATSDYDKSSIIALIDAYFAKGFECELGLRDCMVNFSSFIDELDFADETKIRELLRQMRSKYAKFWEHDLEHYRDDQTQMRDIIPAIMTARIIADCGRNDVRITLAEKQDCVPEKIYDALITEVDAILSHYVTEEDVKYGA